MLCRLLMLATAVLSCLVAYLVAAPSPAPRAVRMGKLEVTELVVFSKDGRHSFSIVAQEGGICVSLQDRESGRALQLASGKWSYPSMSLFAGNGGGCVFGISTSNDEKAYIHFTDSGGNFKSFTMDELTKKE